MENLGTQNSGLLTAWEKKETENTRQIYISDESNIDNDGKLSQNYYYKSWFCYDLI